MGTNLSSLESKERLTLSGIFFIVIALLIGDVIDDLSHGSTLSHVLVEAGIILLCLVGMITIWLQLFISKKEVEKLSLDLTRVQTDLEKWKKETSALSKGLSEKIDEQLNDWKLTHAEKEICLLILKGLSNKEIADIRQTSEKTVRQQASGIYQKSNLSNRNELSAFFLEDLLVIPN
ncbi:MAG: response regulator transcription factor [Deltaproteobacteria bacterium]|nr:MAG: response regulator transcription factor [Deltaproteobacteria bacterium]